jgi:hypothetical protein
MGEAIRIDGLAQFSRNLKKLDGDLPKALRIALNDAANLVVDDARPDIPRRTGRAAASLKAASTRTSVRIRGGGNRAPRYPWLDFGGRVGRDRSVVRPFIKEGRYVYPAYFRHRDSGHIQQVLSRALVDVARSAGVEVD